MDELIFVYLVKLRDQEGKISYYTGITNDPPRRLKQHKMMLSGGALYCTRREVLGMKILYNTKNRKTACWHERQIKKFWSHRFKQQRYDEANEF